MYFIDEGEVAVLSNNESAVLFKLNPGQYFGERTFLLGEPRPSTIRLVLLLFIYLVSGTLGLMRWVYCVLPYI